jgi:hypothetical protein
MVYTPAWSATFAKPLLNQAIAIIQRDQPAALSIVNPELAPIQEFHKGPTMRTAFPWLTLAVDKTEFDPNSPWIRAWRASLILTLDVGQFDQEIAQDNGQDYARSLDMILTTASGADWTTPLPIVHETAPSGMTSPPMTGSVKAVFVESHRYSSVNQPGLNAPVLRVMLSVLFQVQET